MVPLKQNVVVTEAVEEWLADLSTSMVKTLSAMLVKCLSEKDYETFPSQILSLADQVHFSKTAEVAITRGALPSLPQRFARPAPAVHVFDVEGMRVMQLKIQSFVLDLIHSIDIVEQLLEETCSDVGQWAWQRQLRYYDQGHAGEVNVRWITASFRIRTNTKATPHAWCTRR